VVLTGAVEIALHADGTDRHIARYGPGGFVGELNLVTGLRLFVSARVVEPGEVVSYSRRALQHVLATETRLGDTLLRAFMAPRALLLRGGGVPATRGLSVLTPDAPDP